MARQGKGKRTSRSAREIVNEKATQYAEWNRVDVGRVLNIFERTARDKDGRPLLEKGELKDISIEAVSFWPSLEDATASLGPKKALNLFETEDLEKLGKRAAITLYLRDPDTPLYNLKELEQLTESFIPYLERNREYLIKTGHPRIKFQRSPWLDWNLTRLYFTKQPVQVYETLDSPEEPVFSYDWPDRPIERLGIPPADPFWNSMDLRRGDQRYWYSWAMRGVNPAKDGSQVTACDYDDAALIGGLSEDDAARLEAGRKRFFELKIEILEELLRDLRRRTPACLWENCEALLTQELLSDDANFYLKRDRFYSGYDVRTGRKVGKQVRLAAGGLTDLLRVIGHYEKELSVETLARTRNTLGSLVKLTPLGHQCLASRDYFHAVKKGKRKTLDDAIDLLLSLSEQERRFWTLWCYRINEALKKKFKVPLWVEQELKPHIGKYYEWVKDYWKRSGRFPSLGVTVATGHSRMIQMIAEFPFIEGLQWKEVTMEFVSDHAIRISARDVSKTYTFAEIGFRDRRGPDTRWIILKEAFARHNGKVDWATDLDMEGRGKLKYAVRDLRKRLKAIIRIEKDPFHPYHEVKGYMTKFELRDNTPYNHDSYRPFQGIITESSEKKIT